MKKQIFVSRAVYLSTLLAFLPLMSQPTLTPGEKAANEQSQPMTTENLSISEVYAGGQFVKTNDGTVFEIAPKDRDVSGGWLGGDLRVECQGSGEYPCKLHNKWTGSTVSARRHVEEPAGQP